MCHKVMHKIISGQTKIVILHNIRVKLEGTDSTN